MKIELWLKIHCVCLFDLPTDYIPARRFQVKYDLVRKDDNYNELLDRMIRYVAVLFHETVTTK